MSGFFYLTDNFLKVRRNGPGQITTQYTFTGLVSNREHEADVLVETSKTPCGFPLHQALNRYNNIHPRLQADWVYNLIASPKNKKSSPIVIILQFS